MSDHLICCEFVSHQYLFLLLCRLERVILRMCRCLYRCAEGICFERTLYLPLIRRDGSWDCGAVELERTVWKFNLRHQHGVAYRHTMGYNNIRNWAGPVPSGAVSYIPSTACLCTTNVATGPCPGQVRRYFMWTRTRTMEVRRQPSVFKKRKSGLRG